MLKFDILNRFTGRAHITVDIDTTPDAPHSVKLGLAIRVALKSRADLYGADLYGADLSGADLYGANLYGADLSRAKGGELVLARTRILPEGTLVGWKKCAGGVIVKLRIPEEAKRCHAFGRKCRAEFADVIEIFGADHGISSHDRKTRYEVGKRVTCDEWGDDWTIECSGGIHFFITRAEAENY